VTVPFPYFLHSPLFDGSSIAKRPHDRILFSHFPLFPTNSYSRPLPDECCQPWLWFPNDHFGGAQFSHIGAPRPFSLSYPKRFLLLFPTRQKPSRLSPPCVFSITFSCALTPRDQRSSSLPSFDLSWEENSCDMLRTFLATRHPLLKLFRIRTSFLAKSYLKWSVPPVSPRMVYLSPSDPSMVFSPSASAKAGLLTIHLASSFQCLFHCISLFRVQFRTL